MYDELSRRIVQRLSGTPTSPHVAFAEQYGLTVRRGAPVLFSTPTAPQLNADEYAALLRASGTQALILLPVVEVDV